VLTVTLNPALDLTVSLGQLNTGAVNKALSGHLHAAGKGINVSAVLKDLKHNVIATGYLGEDNHSLFHDFCENFNVKNEFIYLPGATRINVKISESSAQVTDINLPGLSVPPAFWTRLKKSLTLLTANCSAVILAGSLPPGLNSNAYAELITLFNDCDIPVLVDTSAEALVHAVAAKPTLIKPNTHELGELTGTTIQSESEIIAAGRKLVASGISNVVISDGPNGCYWITQNKVIKAVPPEMHVISTVGAGDSLVAGLAHTLVNDMDLHQGLQLACAISAHAVEQIGVGIMDEARLKQITEQVQLSEIHEN
jgi:1-phosphofructokinase